jgi:dipeptidyl aminopeptidase/acylaminoacyl peptidase
MNQTAPTKKPPFYGGDFRDHPFYAEAKYCFEQALQPGTGKFTSATAVAISPDGQQVAFCGLRYRALGDTPNARLAFLDRSSGATNIVGGDGPYTDDSPCYSPDGRTLAFRSDRERPGNFQLHLIEVASGTVCAAPHVEGWVEYLEYSPDGRNILLGVAGHGADIASAQGATSTRRAPNEHPAWMPQVKGVDEDYRRRSVWIYELASGQIRKVSPPQLNIWESAWCGNEAMVAVATTDCFEDVWFESEVFHFTLAGGEPRRLYKPKSQIGRLSCSPDGFRAAFVEAVASDRGMCAGELRIADILDGSVRKIESGNIDVTHTAWRDSKKLLIAGIRDIESVVAEIDTAAGTCLDLWKCRELYPHNGRYPWAAAATHSDVVVMMATGHLQAPRILLVTDQEQTTLVDFSHEGTAALVRKLRPVEPYRWTAPDGRKIQGWLMRGSGTRPAPLVMDVHGGPIWRNSQFFLGATAHWVMLAERGYALFWPNPRGSTGWGQGFSSLVVGDMCGADTQDLLSGLDQLVADGIADPERIGVTGGSYGGTMTNWLVTQDSRFAAAVPQFPAANWVSRHLTSYFSRWVFTFLDGHYKDLSSKYHSRSPVMFAHQVKTPTLNICGALDQCTPPGQALEFHNALRENGVESMLVTYPQEGHGIRTFPAKIDYSARIVDWFTRHLSLIV